MKNKRTRFKRPNYKSGPLQHIERQYENILLEIGIIERNMICRRCSDRTELMQRYNYLKQKSICLQIFYC